MTPTAAATKPSRKPAGAPARPRLADLKPQAREITLHGNRVAYRTAGDGGPVLLLIHGITGCAKQWDDIMPLLADRYTVVAPDLLGHGESAKPKGDYSLGAYAAGIRDLLVALGHRRATVVGPLARRRHRDAVRLRVPAVRGAARARLERRPRPRGERPAACGDPPGRRDRAAADRERAGAQHRRGPSPGGVRKRRPARPARTSPRWRAATRRSATPAPARPSSTPSAR